MLKAIILNIILLLHPVHVTLTTVTQDEGSDTMKVFFRMYYDDFLLDYKNYYPGFNPGEITDTSRIFKAELGKYLNDRVRIYINNKLLTGNISDVSIDSFEIRISLEYNSFIEPVRFRIINTILTTVNSDQANMVYLTIGKYQNALNLTGGNFDAGLKLR